MILKQNKFCKINSPKISIIVAVYNGEATLQNCIDSIIKQKYDNKELIIMDGASTDATPLILKANSFHITYWESKIDRGIAHAWNKAIRYAAGDWILFLGSDDKLEDSMVLSDMANKLRENIDDDVIYGRIVFEGGNYNGFITGEAKNLLQIKKRMVIPHTATFHRRTFLDAVGPYNETFKMAMDYELLLRKKTFSALFVDRRVAVMGGFGVSSRLLKESILEGRRAQLINKIDWRIKIELLHLYYQLRIIFKFW